MEKSQSNSNLNLNSPYCTYLQTMFGHGSLNYYIISIIIKLTNKLFFVRVGQRFPCRIGKNLCEIVLLEIVDYAKTLRKVVVKHPPWWLTTIWSETVKKASSQFLRPSHHFFTSHQIYGEGLLMRDKRRLDGQICVRRSTFFSAERAPYTHLESLEK